MTFITKYLSTLDELKKELESKPENIKFYAKYEGFTGESDSIEYINQKLKEYYESKKSN